MSEDQKPPEPPLFDDVKGASSRKLLNSVEKVDALTSEEEADLERGGAFALRGTKRRILRAFMWAGFVFGVVLLLGLCLALLVILGFRVYEVIQTGTTAEVLASMLEFLFGVAATIAIERILLRGKPEE